MEKSLSIFNIGGKKPQGGAYTKFFLVQLDYCFYLRQCSWFIIISFSAYCEKSALAYVSSCLKKDKLSICCLKHYQWRMLLKSTNMTKHKNKPLFSSKKKFPVKKGATKLEGGPIKKIFLRHPLLHGINFKR